ncbi:MAG: hypothetical protein WCO02_08350 [Bacteroidota bacterium]
MFKEKRENTRNHVIISGTGRAGTTFLVKLLSNLGLETSFSQANFESNIDLKSMAGLELDIRETGAPYIVKSPWICDYIDELLNNDQLKIDYAFIPLRDIHEAAKSRIMISANRDKVKYIKPSDAPGGLWGTDNPDEQEYILHVKLLKLLLSLSARNIPVVFIHFPKMTLDPSYLYKKLMPILKEIEFQKFEEVFNSTVRREHVHSY